MRLTDQDGLPTGQWVELRERISHADDKKLKRQGRKTDPGSVEVFDWATEVVRMFVRDWSILDPDGKAIPVGDKDAVERAPSDVIDLLFDKASELYAGATVPNSPTPS